MRNFRRACAAVALACVFTAAVNAGDMHTGVTSPPPPPPAAPTFFDMAWSLLQGVFFVL